MSSIILAQRTQCQLASQEVSLTVRRPRMFYSRSMDSDLQTLLLNDTIPFRHRGTKADLGVIEQIFQRQDYHLQRVPHARELVAVYQSIEAEGKEPLVLDCGANIGASALFFHMTFPTAQVLAVEPEAGNFAVLTANIEELSGVSALQAAISSQGQSQVQVVDPGEGEWGYRTASSAPVGSRACHTVRTVSIPELIDGSEAVPFLLKIDIEGAESELFTQNTDRFCEFPLIIIELHDWMLPGTANSRPFLRWHAEQDRDFVLAGENVFSVRNPL